MAANAASSAGIFRHGKAIAWTSVVLGVIAAGVFGIVTAISIYHRGIYAGYHYSDARQVVMDKLYDRYGSRPYYMRFANPPVLNTHHLGPFGTDAGQIRVFHVIGRRGIHYCVSLWRSSVNRSDHVSIQKGCKF